MRGVSFHPQTPCVREWGAHRVEACLGKHPKSSNLYTRVLVIPIQTRKESVPFGLTSTSTRVPTAQGCCDSRAIPTVGPLSFQRPVGWSLRPPHSYRTSRTCLALLFSILHSVWLCWAYNGHLRNTHGEGPERWQRCSFWPCLPTLWSLHPCC